MVLAKHRGSYIRVLRSSSSSRHLRVKRRRSFEVFLLPWVNSPEQFPRSWIAVILAPECQRDTGFTSKQRENSQQCFKCSQKSSIYASTLQQQRAVFSLKSKGTTPRILLLSKPGQWPRKESKRTKPKQSKPFEFALAYEEQHKEEFGIDNDNLV